MAYNPSISDISELEGVEGKSKSTYTPSLSDITEASQAGKQPGFFSGLVRGVPMGLGESARGAINLQRRLTEPELKAGGMQPTVTTPFSDQPVVNPFYPGAAYKQTPGVMTREEAGIPEAQGAGEKIGEFAGEVAPSFALPEMRLTRAPRAIERAVSESGKITKGIAHTLGIAGKNALVGAGLGPMYSPDQSIGQSAATGAVLGGVGGPALRGAAELPGLAGRGINTLLQMGGTHTPEEIQQAVSQAPGGQLPLGEAIGSPSLKQFQSAILSKVPLSGMAKKYTNLAKALTEPVQGVLDKFKGNIETNTPDDIVSHLKGKFKDKRDISRDNYEQLNQLADSTNSKFDYSNYKNEGKKALNAIKEEKKAAPEWDAFDSDSGKQIFKVLSNIEEKPSLGKFKDAGLTDKRLNDFLREAKSNNDNNAIRIIAPLKTALDKDYESSAIKSENPQVYSAWKGAKEFFKNEVVPLQDKDILKFIKDKVPASQITQNFVKKGASENPEKLSKLTQQLPENLRQSLAHHFLTKGRELSTPEEINKGMREYGNLGPRSRNILFTPEENKTIQDSLATSKRLGAQKNQLFIPKTGEQSAVAKALELALSGGAGAAAYMGAIPLALKTGGLLAAPAAITKTIMSPAVRNVALKAAKRAEKAKKPTSKASSKMVPSIYGALLSR